MAFENNTTLNLTESVNKNRREIKTFAEATMPF